MNARRNDPLDPYAQATEVVRVRDPDRYIADLFAPSSARRHLFALHAFDVETARVRSVVSEPALGEIRLQWWRDAIANGSGGGHPTAAALIETITRFNLPVDAFMHLLEARVFDLYDDAMPTLNDLEGYAGETAGALIQMAAIILAAGHDPGSAEAAGHAGVALALVGLLRALPVYTARGQCYLPLGMMRVRGLSRETMAAGELTPELGSLLRDLRTIARQHLSEAERALAEADPAVTPAFLPLALVEPYLERMDRDDYNPFAGPVEVPRWKRQWILWRAARKM